MPTFKILAGKEKEDKTIPVMIRLYHNGQKKYLATGHLINKKQLTAKGIIKDRFVNDAVAETIKGYRSKLLKLSDVNSRSADYIKEYLKEKDEETTIDFIKFGRDFIATQAVSTGKNTETVLNSFVDFIDRHILPIEQLTLNILNSYALYLRSERTVTRSNGTGGEIKMKLAPISDTGLKDYIGKLRQIFKAAQDHYNDEDSGRMRIAHYPFRKFKMPKAAKAKKRNLKPAAIRLIRDCPDMGIRADIGRDVFMLSFYLVGINAADLFIATDYKAGRLSYNRAKTVSRKGDEAFISIKVEPEAKAIFEKYKDHTGKRVFNFYHKYANADSFIKGVNVGLKQVCEAINKEKVRIDSEVSTYYARGAWSTIARNDCKIPKEDIHFALNHSDPSMKVTDLYIEEDFSIIDKANRKVINLVNKKS